MSSLELPGLHYLFFFSELIMKNTVQTRQNLSLSLLAFSTEHCISKDAMTIRQIMFQGKSNCWQVHMVGWMEFILWLFKDDTVYMCIHKTSDPFLIPFITYSPNQ